MKMRAVVKGIGHALPEKVLTNFDLEKFVDTTDEWIVQRTGIRERRVSEPHETASTFAVEASREALEHAGIGPDDVEIVICATVSGDYNWPATACLVQDKLGLRNVGAFDLSAACAGSIYALALAASMVEAGHVRTALVIGVDTLTKQIDWTDRSTCILFGDGAGAMVIQAEIDTDRGLIETVLMSDGGGSSHIILEAGGSKYPYGTPEFETHRHYISMAGSEVYRFAVQAMGDACCKVLDKSGMTAHDIDLFVPHQANLRIIESAAKRIGLPAAKVFVNVERYGNTSAASVPLGLYEADRDGRLRPGMVVMTVGFGAGLVWGANLIRW